MDLMRTLLAVLACALLALPARAQLPARAPNDGAADAIAGLRAALSEQLAKLRDRIEAIDRELKDDAGLARHLARRVEYFPGSKDPAERIPIHGPFVPGKKFAIVRQGTSALETYTVLEIYGNGWMRVQPGGEGNPMVGFGAVFLNADQVVLAAPLD